MDAQQPTTVGRKRSKGADAIGRTAALERLRALRRGERRSESSYQFKIEEPIYDVVDEDQYKDIVAGRRDEFGDFIVDDEENGGINLGYRDDGEEEDWTQAGFGYSDIESEGEESERLKKRKKSEKKEKDSQQKKPSTSAAASALSAAAALMGKTKISSMFTSSAFKKRSEDKSKALSCDSIVDDVIAEFAPDNADRERRRTRQSINLGVVSSPKTSVRIEKPVVGSMGFAGRTELENKVEIRNSPSIDLGQSYEKTENKEPVEELKAEGGSNDLENAAIRQVDKPLENRDMREQNAEVAGEVKADVKLEKGEENVFSLNARVNEAKEKPFTATAEWDAVRSAGYGDVGVVDYNEKSEFALDSDGSLPFYIIDAYEENYGANMGTIYLFGKVKAGNSFHSCCVVVKNNNRCIYAIPHDSVFNNEEVIKGEKDESESTISTATFRKKLQDVASGLKNEIGKKLIDLNVSTFTMTPVKRKYAFERLDIPAGENYVLKVNYPFKDPPLPSDLKGETFNAVLGTHTSALELFLIKRKIKGPCWLSVSKFSSSSHQQVSWCKFEILVDCPKDIRVMKNQAEVPRIIVTALNLKTMINEKQNMNEIISASIISCSKVKIDTPMLASEWKRPGVLNHLTVVRKLEGGIFPMGFTKDATDKNSKAGSNVLVFESSERALLNRVMAELYKLDSDVLVGHNISGFDLDILLHRTQACRVPSTMWSKIGRLKRSAMPKLTKGSTIFGSGASPGITSCIAGRLLCDTYLCSRDLLKEVSYSLTQLSKTQLNKDRKEIAPNDIPKMFQKSETLMELIECNETDAWLSMELMFHLSVLPLTRQMTNISGNLWGKTLQGARAQRVEYLLLHAFHREKYIVPDKYSSHGKENKPMKKKEEQANGGDLNDTNLDNEALKDNHGKGKKGPAFAGGLVLEPKRGLYDRYILLLDFNSLYPSIIQEYNICFTTVERSYDGAVPHIPSCNSPGVLPKLLKGLVETRKRVKSWLKSASGLKAQQLDIQQQALKLTANSMYGCLGFSNSRFYAKPLAELITLQGREILQSTVDLVQNNLNLEVIYGDTDSIMIYSGLDDIVKAKAIAGKVIQEVNKKYRCLEIDLDGLYKRMLLLKKKKYAAVKVQIRNGQPYEVIERKGLDMVRRDWSLLSKELGDFCLSQILSGGSCEDVVESIHSSLMKIQEEMRNGEVTLEKYIITKSLTKPPEAYPDAKNQPHVQVALRLKQNGYSTGCSAGDTVPYIICCEEGSTAGTSAGMAQRARHPDELKRDNGKWMIDIDYYLSQQIHPVISRLCACIQGTSPARLADCLGLDPSKFQSKTSEAASEDPSPLLLCSADDEDRYQGCESLTLSCPSCSNTFECPSVFSSICKQTKEQSEETSCDFWRRLRCLKCPQEGDVGRLSPMMIANQVKKQAERFISIYYTGLMTCDDETCKYTTRSLNIRVIGDSERGTVCPNYPSCNGRLVRKYSEADLYKQLTYFCHVLDTVRCIEKIDGEARIPFEREMARCRPVAEPAATTVQKLRDRCGYGWVQLKDLFAFA